MSYFNHSKNDIEKMLSFLGMSNIDELFTSIPEEIQLKRPLKIKGPYPESELVKLSEEIKGSIKTYREIFRGAGAYKHFIPAAVDEITSRAEFYTAYTPYQPEVSQGSLQAIFEYQTMMSELTGLPVSNASMYDGASATAESILMAWRHNKKSTVLISEGIHPEYLQVINTYIRHTGITVHTIPLTRGLTNIEGLKDTVKDDISSIVIQSPNFYGNIEEPGKVKEIFPEASLIYVTNEALSLPVLKKPSDHGADICCGEAQSLGIPLSAGGPYLGFITCSNEYLHTIPGRLVGVTKDSNGKRAYTMTLSAREQHIRRERATSNICSNHALMAIRAVVYMSLMGVTGLRSAALLSIKNAHRLYRALIELKNVEPVYPNTPFFHEFLLKIPLDRKKLTERLERNSYLGPLEISTFPYLKENSTIKNSEEESLYLFNTTELNTEQGIDYLYSAIKESLL